MKSIKVFLHGGRFLNRGLTGAVMELYNKNSEDKNTLYKDIELAELNNIEIKLVTINEKTLKDETIELDKKDFKFIKTFIKRKTKKTIVKKYLISNSLFSSNEKNFNDELQGYKNLIQIFKGNVSKYTTIKNGFIYKRKKIYGIIIGKTYYVFMEKCFKTIEKIDFTEKTLKKCTNQIIEILNILNANDYIHNDIKADNIILCRKRFKLIDWETSNFIKDFEMKDKQAKLINSKNGNLTFNHPVKFYRINYPYYFYRYIYDIEIMSYSYLNNLESPRLLTSLVEKSYNKVIAKYSELSKIKHKINNKTKSLSIDKISEDEYYYFKLADYYSFALTIIYIAEKCKIKYPSKIINKILSYYFINLK